MLFCIPV